MPGEDVRPHSDEASSPENETDRISTNQSLTQTAFGSNLIRRIAADRRGFFFRVFKNRT